MRKLLPTTAFFTFLVCFNAYGADLVEEPPSPFIPTTESDIPEWNGAYAGVNLGFGQIDGVFTSDCLCSTHAGSSSKQAGVFLGFNWQLDERQWVGIEGDVNYDAGKIRLWGADVGADFTGSVRLRVGEEIGNGLLYAAIGWTAANLRVQNPDDSATAQGWTLGAGIDWAVDDATFVRAEYRFNDYASTTLSGVDVDFEQGVVRIGIAHRF